MNLNPEKVRIALARHCLNMTSLRACGFSPRTIAIACRGERITTKTAGIIARYIGVDVVELMEARADV